MPIAIPAAEGAPGQRVPIVCVGGSAGGLDAYTRLLSNVSADMGVGIVIVNQLRTVATQLHIWAPPKLLPCWAPPP